MTLSDFGDIASVWNAFAIQSTWFYLYLKERKNK